MSGSRTLYLRHSPIFGTAAPGFLLLYVYKPDLIEKLDIVKLIIFSMALPLPVLVVNGTDLFAIILLETEKDTEVGKFIVGGNSYQLA